MLKLSMSFQNFDQLKYVTSSTYANSFLFSHLKKTSLNKVIWASFNCVRLFLEAHILAYIISQPYHLQRWLILFPLRFPRTMLTFSAFSSVTSGSHYSGSQNSLFTATIETNETILNPFYLIYNHIHILFPTSKYAKPYNHFRK